MCGIAGILYSERDRPVEPRLLLQMDDAIAHRGPDASARWIGPGVGLSHRRLSIIDLATGDQPLANSDGSLRVTFNGEIYNYRELREQLERAGHRFRTRSDTEVLLHLYQERGPRLVDWLRGMFAFALWDGRKEQLLLARDRVGIKPLYFLRDKSRFLFGSELKAILAVPDVAREINVQALEDYVTFGVIQGEQSIVKNVTRLLPGRTMVVTREQLDAPQQRYWALRMRPDPGWTEAEAIEVVRSKIAETVRAHLVADVPVGAFLSGGLDSGVVVGVAAQNSTLPLQTFCIGFREQAFSEAAEARLTADRFGSEHHEEIATADSMTIVDELTRFFDEPFADSSAVPTYLVSRLAAQHVKVVLSGDGGDEAFGGYTRYRDDLREWRFRTTLPISLRRHVVGPLATVWPKTDWLPRPMRAKTFLTNVSSSGGTAYANSLTICRAADRQRLLSPDIRARLIGYDPATLVSSSYDCVGDVDPIAAMIGADVDVQLPDDYLTKVDRASMAHGLEVRPVFADHELLELMATVPSRFKVRGRTTKWLLRTIYRNFLPPGTTHRQKRGFAVPLDLWFRGPLKSVFTESVLESRGVLDGVMDLHAVRRLFNGHCGGVGHHGATLWAILMLARWFETYLVTPTSEARMPAGCP